MRVILIWEVGCEDGSGSGSFSMGDALALVFLMYSDKVQWVSSL
jgi:hypothetical protein